MCGINGILRLTPAAPPIDARELVATRDAMAARGPDGEGLWLSPDGRVGFGHRRLAIIDLSLAGAQPMHSADGRYTIVFNGEIYNHRELRAELERGGARFRSSSDTEVLLQLFARDDVRVFERIEGMYAFALWDARDERLVLARDPFGIKPLYYACNGRVLRFASQVRALEAGGAVSLALDPAALAGFLLWGSVPEPLTLRRAVRALPAGHALEVRRGHVGQPWPLPRPTSPSDAGDPLAVVAAALERSVRLHLVSDVPVGIFLSAGLDSALLTALVRHARNEPPETFTLTFDEFAGGPLDEGPGAATVAAALGTCHREQRVPHEALDDLWSRALAAMDQPSIDGFNVFVVSHFAREAGLKVVLSGLGGDELFGSYPSFRDVPRWTRWARRASSVPGLAAAWPVLARLASNGHPKTAGLLRHGTTLPGAYWLRRGLFLPEELPMLLGRERAEEGLAAYDPTADAARHLTPEQPDDDWVAVQRLESSLYLRNQLLRDADWASMAHGLELRVPLVTASLSAQLARMRFEPARSLGKAVLARALAPELPPTALTRRKSGFMIPAPLSHGLHARWGTRSRLRAALVLRHFGVDVSLPERAKGGTLFLMPQAFRGHGGIQTYNRAQVQALLRCRPHDPLYALVLNDTATETHQPEWRGIVAEGCARHRARYVWRSFFGAWRQRPDRVLVGHRNLLPLVPLLVLAAPRGERWLLTYGLEIETPFNPVERLLLRGVTRAFAISPHTRTCLRAAGYTRAVELWPCSPPFDWHPPAPAPSRFERPMRLLTVARLAPPERHKGVDDTIRALAQLVESGCDAVLDVAGDGDDRSRLETLTRDLGVATRVRFHGATAPETLRQLYAACDIFVLPSAREGFGIVYLEALAYAKPVVAADAGGVPFVIRPERSGWLVPYGDPRRLASCLADIAAHPDEARRVGEAGRRLLEAEFTFDALVSVTARLLERHG